MLCDLNLKLVYDLSLHAPRVTRRVLPESVENKQNGRMAEWQKSFNSAAGNPTTSSTCLKDSLPYSYFNFAAFLPASVAIMPRSFSFAATNCPV